MANKNISRTGYQNMTPKSIERRDNESRRSDGMRYFYESDPEKRGRADGGYLIRGQGEGTPQRWVENKGGRDDKNQPEE